jgi:hypothetical protein
VSGFVLIYRREPDVLRSLVPFAVKMHMLLTVVCGGGDIVVQQALRLAKAISQA